MTEKIDLQNSMNTIINHVVLRRPVVRDMPSGMERAYELNSERSKWFGWLDRALWAVLSYRQALKRYEWVPEEVTWRNLQTMVLEDYFQTEWLIFREEQDRIPHMLIIGMDEWCQLTGNKPMDFELRYASQEIRVALAKLEGVTKPQMNVEVRVVPWMSGWMFL